MQFCPYKDCDGNVVMDSWNWSDIKEAHPEYPDRPRRGQIYPMYEYPKGHERAYKPDAKDGEELL